MTRSMLAMSFGAVAAAGALAVGATGSRASVNATRQACGTFSGLAWVDPVNGMKGTHWTVSTTGGVGCAFAMTWAVKLAKRVYAKGPPGRRIGGPAGWSCHRAIEVGGGTPGFCRKSSLGRFDWGYTS
jgi:hypothetical protein